MPPAIHPQVRNVLGYALCLFCLLRPLWGWMDRKAEAPQAKPTATQEASEPPKREANVLGETLAPKLASVAPLEPGAE